MLPAIFGLAGPTLTDAERGLFSESDPCGYILFGRNIVDPDQSRRLTDDLRALSGRDRLPILIDQEGGRVARLRAPHWPPFPSGEAFQPLWDLAPISAMEAVRANAEALALTLAALGITVACYPLLDVRGPDTHAAIGDRALGSDPAQVASLGRAALRGLSDGGVVGVVKHMPGQGRADLDSHLALPRVSADAAALERDLHPFRQLADAPMGMTAHVVYEAWDAERPATMSPVVIRDVIRGTIGFDGFLMSDDLDMKALSGGAGELAAQCVAAGCDAALNCWGRMEEMVAIARALPAMGTASLARLDRAMASVAAPDPSRLAEMTAKRDALLALAGGGLENAAAPA